LPELITDFLTKPIPKVPHIIGRGILPVASLGVLYGEPKHNKSYVVLNMMMDLAAGRNIFNAEYQDGSPVLPVSKPYKILYIEQEIGDDGLRERLLGMTGGEIPVGIDLYIKSRDMQMRLDTDEGKLAIAQEIDAVKPDLVILDPLAEFQLINENSAQEMGASVRVLKRWIERFKCAILVIHHAGKVDFDNPRKGGARIRGSSALFGAVDTSIEVTRKSEPSSPSPILEIAFDIRRGKPILPIYVRREETGRITYIGDKWTGGMSAGAVDTVYRRPRKALSEAVETKSKYEEL